MRFYRQAVEIDPGYAPARVRLAASLEKVGQAGEADAHYEEAARLEPDNAVAHLGLGRLALARSAKSTRPCGISNAPTN